jgi:hypothetical protein
MHGATKKKGWQPVEEVGESASGQREGAVMGILSLGVKAGSRVWIGEPVCAERDGFVASR